LREAVSGHGHAFGLSQQRTEARDGRLKGAGDGSAGQIKCILREQQPARRADSFIAEQDMADALEQLGAAREPAAGIKARRKRTRARERNAPVRRPYAVDPAEARRRAHRPPGVAAKREIAQAARDRCRRAAGGPARDTPRRVDVDWCPVMSVLPVETPGDLVGVGLADHVGARVEQALHHWRGTRGRIVRA